MAIEGTWDTMQSYEVKSDLNCNNHAVKIVSHEAALRSLEL